MIKRMTAMLTVFIMVVAAVSAQTTQRSTSASKESEDFSLQRVLGREDALLRPKSLPMEGAIDPAEYIVGPSDVIYVALWGPVNLSYPITVTPEGTMIIPMVGELSVAGKSLARVKAEVKEAVRAKYKIGEITVTLFNPREFSVTVKGAVLREGQYTASAVDRVEKILVQSAGRESPRATVTLPLPETTPVSGATRGTTVGRREQGVEIPQVKLSESIDDRASLRNIRLVRKNGEVLHIDLLRYYVTRENRLNPFLLDGDLIFVPTRNLSSNFVTVDGAVHAPGRYEFVEGDDLLTLLGIAQGLTTAGDSSSVTISRQNERGEITQEILVNLRAVVRNEVMNPPLLRGDRILVKAVPSKKNDNAVIVSGEVMLPGQYPISLDGTRLSKVLRDAGGPTPRALLTGSVVLRREDRLEGFIDSRFNLIQLLRAGNLGPADSAFYQTDFEIGRYPVVVDFTRLLVQGDTTQDVILHDGDLIHLASDHQTVLVQGQVANPGYIAYLPHARVDYYLRKAGGLSEQAKSDEIRVIKKGSMEWVEPGKTDIQPGDRIWVPKKPRRESEYYLQMIGNVASILAAVATTVLLAIRIAQ